MGTQDKGSRASAICGDATAWGWQRRACAKLSTYLGLVMMVAALWTSAARAQTTNYVYDANGRVVAVTQNNGTTAQYTYDTLGHLAQTTTVASGQLAIFAFIPTHGEAGAQVTIEGQGFSASPASDSVTFNGTPATVVSATTGQIVAIVPSGATTGPIGVSLGGNTAASATPFVIDDTGLPPTITQVSPVVVDVGAAVTVSGTHLYPVTGGTSIQIGNGPLSPSIAADTALQYVVPSDATSSFVTVTTPYGSTTSPNQVIVLPSGISASSVVSNGYAAMNGANTSVTIGAAAQNGAVIFNAQEGAWISLQASNITAAEGSITYTIYSPGNAVLSQGAISASSPSIHLPQLPTSGTYLAIFQASTANTQFSIAAVTDATLVSGTPLAASTSSSWLSERFVFNVATTSNMEVALDNLSVAGSSSNGVDVNIYNSAGTNVGSFGCYTSNPGDTYRLALWNLAPGTYSVIVTPLGGGTMSFNTLLQPDVIGPALAPAKPVSVNMAEGQVERFTFNANAGDTYALQLSGVNTSPTGQNVLVDVYSPTTTPITPYNYYANLTTSSSSVVNLSNLPVSGTYTVVVFTTGIPASGQLTLVPGVTGNLSNGGAAQSYSTTILGQNAYLNFVANAGDNLELTLENVSANGGSGVEMNVYNSAGINVGSFTCSNTQPGALLRLALWNLAAGTYSVVVTPVGNATMSFDALLQSDSIGGVLTDNSTIAINLAIGQVDRLTFNANAGSNFTLQLSNASTLPAGQRVYVYVYDPATTPITPYNDNFSTYTTTASLGIALTNLPSTGTYTVVIFTTGIPAVGQMTLVPQ